MDVRDLEEEDKNDVREAWVEILLLKENRSGEMNPRVAACFKQGDRRGIMFT